jgi:hypothetical protein
MNSNLYLDVGAAAVVIVLLMVIKFFRGRSPKELNVEYFQLRWKEMQKMCRDKKTWPLAVIDADNLLDEALKKRRIKGKTMGERLVTVQHTLTNNDGVWFAHKLRNKIVHEDFKNLKEADVKDALIGFRQALKDMGALK